MYNKSERNLSDRIDNLKSKSEELTQKTIDGSKNTLLNIPVSAVTDAVAGPSSATDGNLAVFDGTTGKLLKDSEVPIEYVDYARNVSNTNGVSRIPSPRGGLFAINSTNQIGAITIRLPSIAYESTAMLMFHIDIFNYATDNSNYSFVVGGYLYAGSPKWINVSAARLGGSSKNVRFWTDGIYAYVSIGEVDTDWDYPKVCVRDVLAGHSYADVTNWDDDWVISIKTSFGTVAYTKAT